ncbi:methyl-accepting chemotaxis protein [Aquincola sp. J276]|uniref:methyl-accepting chemotaxis protein n=1 Tax=Aquincola sp. J276 TaxID=2898432 RepID=UPI002150F3EF|nr:methyl-accepting chemotaxis protein [Aquincola sp. J276]MCR5868170.1 methyl-accepting chemotaxis protein [Aquincola sp. J276]
MFQTVRTRLTLACVAVVVLALLCVTAVNYLIVQRHVQAQTTRDLDMLAAAHAQGIGHWVATQKAVVAALAPATAVADPVPFLIQAQKSGGLASAYAGFADKRMIFDVPQQLPAGYDPTARPWYSAAASSETPVLTAPYVDAASKRLIVTFAMAVKGSGSTKAVVASDVFLDDVSKTVAAIRPTARGLAFLVDQKGVVIAHPQTQWLMQGVDKMSSQLSEAAITAATATEGHWVEAALDDSPYLLRGATVPGTPWILVTAAQKDEALASLSSLLVAAAGALLLMAVLAAIATSAMVRTLLASLGRINTAMSQIGSGEADLTQRLPVHGHDEMAMIAASFNAFTDKIAQTILEVRHSSESISTASTEIASGNTDLSQRTEETASNLQQTASALEQITSTVRQSAENAQLANQLASSAASVAQRGGEVVGEVVTTMDQIQQSSRRIADIIGVIDGIAFQTNILALNAAVEAARAGEQGRGFAVVASEVRTLAGRSAEAAREIKGLIAASVERVDAGSRLVGDAGQTMAQIVGSVQRVSDVISEITAAAREQSAGIELINGSVNTLDQMTQQNAALVEQSAAAAESLKEQAGRLHGVVSTFQLH